MHLTGGIFAMKKIILLVFAFSFLVSVSVLGAEPDTAAPTGSGLAGAGEPAGGSAPNLDVNQAELEENGGSLPLHPELQSNELTGHNVLMERIGNVMAAADLNVDQLQTRLDATTNNAQALEIIKQLEQVKIQAELDMLAVQATFARENGREEIALEIERAISQMTSPRPTRQPMDRPTPHAGNH